MAFQQPVVLEYISVPEFVQYLLDRHSGPSTLIVCGSKEAFLEQLLSATAQKASDVDDESSQTREPRQDEEVPQATPARSWAVPTLRFLSASRTVKVAFCPDITHLRAYLATYATRLLHDASPPSSIRGDDERLLAICNPVQLHRPTSAFSAQGLNRTFSAAIEAACHSNSKLVVAECTSGAPTSEMEPDTATAQENHAEERHRSSSPWDQEVSILNVTTKNFGAGERGWVGRTVKLRAIVGRWCMFESHSRLSND